MARAAEGVRRVVLRYADGGSDLIAVGPRGGHVGPVDGLESAPPPPWGLPDGTPGAPYTLPITELGDETSWLTALGVTLARYGSEDALLGTDHGAYVLRDAKPVPASGPVLAGLLFGDVEWGGEYVPCLAPPFPLTVSVVRDVVGVRLRCDHRGSHFSGEIAAQFVRHLVHVHRQVLDEVPPSEVELLDAGERERVVALGRAGRIATSGSGAVSVVEAFAQIAGRAPERIAVTDGAEQLTYGELDVRAGELARGLVQRGVAPGDRVGVCLDRTAELVVVLLAVLKAGGTYVPVDPAYPAERIAYTARDAGLRVMVTRSAGFADAVSPDELVGGDGELPTPGDGPAYVVYTSGSTGRPKGVVVPHRNVIALVDATREEYGLGSRDVWTWFHSAAFDFSVWEIWGCLLTGGRLVVVPYFVSREPDAFRDLLVSEQVSVVSQTPSAFGQLMSVEHGAVGVRLVVFGGEPLDARGVLPWFDLHPACRLVNMYGITETTVHVTEQTLTRALALAGTRSVGRALPGWNLYVTGPEGELLPPGVAGEICVGGAGVALGYLGQEELTAERFVPDPYGDGRLYRSGDLGRLRPDGRLEHLGRIDSQVKVRGFRIELDEIRNVLLEDPEVRTAAVVVHREGDAAGARIDAYVVLNGGSTGTVRERAAGLLPEYMVPATVTALDALPLTANGKLDVPRLVAAPAPAPAQQQEQPFTDDLTARLTRIWSDVLGTDVGPDDDFFELGGNSLFAVRITAALREQGLPAVRLRELYRNPTIRGTVAGLERSGD
ncbi:non-ribosomal peptide synthetase [Streptomyces acidiscabies]|uniref:non-ribosomal peptide synthetase n=1 Tax=Streptomyces acidiscabies TaxID=42234 RepID=UPI000ACC5239|nr:non-ribosomal peptide synthetase [Streptomyces acidiscabies]